MSTEASLRRVLAEHGVEPPRMTLDALFVLAQRTLLEPELALRWEADFAPPEAHPAELGARSAATVNAAVEWLAGHAVHFTTMTLTVERDPKETRLVLSARAPLPSLRAFTLGQIAAWLRKADPTLRLRRAWFSRPRPRALQPIATALDTDQLDFGRPDDGLAIAASDGNRALPWADPRLQALAEQLCKTSAETHDNGVQPNAEDISHAVAAALRSRLLASERDCGIDAIAVALGVGTRTLQRRLDDCGTRFSALVDGIRSDLARAWLREPDLGLAEIGYRLGFSDLAAFSRAFKRRHGMPPGTWRRRADFA